MDPKPEQTSPWPIRRTALAGAVMMGLYGAAQSLYHGNSWVRAAEGGLILAIASLTSWVVYHLVSRRRNGIMVLLMPFPHFRDSLKDHQDTEVARMLLLSIGVGLFVGLLIRGTDNFTRRREKPAPATHPMADAGLDATPTA